MTRRYRLHRRIAELLEAGRGHGCSCPAETLAYHFLFGGVQDKAVAYLIEAGAAALHAYAIDDSIRHLTKARELVSELVGIEQKLRLNDLLAAAYSAAALPLKAIEFSRANFDVSNDPLVRAGLLERIADLHFRIGDFDRAVQCFDQALGELGRKRPRTAWKAALGALTCFARYFLPRWLSRGARLAEPQSAASRIEREVYSRFGFLWAQRSVLHTLYASTRQWLLSERLGQPEMLSEAYGVHMMHFGVFSLDRLARRAGKLALAYAEQTGDPKVLAFAKGHLGCGHYFAARLTEAERLLREALTVLDRRGDSWERMFFYHNLRHLYAIWGAQEKEMQSAQVEIQIGETVKDPEGECWGAYGMANALARAGRLEEAREFMQRAKRIIAGKTNIIAVPTALQTEGFLFLQSGEYEAARRALEEARTVIEANFAFVDYSIRVYPLLVETLMGPDWDQPNRAVAPTLVREGWRLSRWALFWAKRFPNYLPHAWRVRGRAAWCKGCPEKAGACFRRALSAAEHIGARYDLARAYLDLGRISDDQRQYFTDKGNELLQQLGCVEPKAKQ